MKLFMFSSASRCLLSIALIALVFLTQSCARRISFETSTVVPAAEGSVKIKKDKNKNYTIDLRVIRLAEPENLQPPKKTYIVWMETEQTGTKNIGRLNTSSGLLSRTLKSSLKTVTPFTPSRFFITAEDYGDPTNPGMPVVLTTRRFN
jgi:hypothetical protein